MERNKNKLQWGILLITVLALAGYAIYTQLINASFLSQKYDPEMAYFMNSLGLLNGHLYYYVDHPGTPINIVGSLIFLLLKPIAALRGDTDFTLFMLQNPEYFLLVTRLLVSFLNIGAVIYIWRSSKDKVSLSGLVLILTSYFTLLTTNYWTYTVYWSHNAFCFSLGTVLLFITIQVLRSTRPRQYKRLAWLGVGAGFLLSIQLYFIAWIIGLLTVIFFWLLFEKQSWRIFVRAISAVFWGAVISFFVVNLPVLHRLPHMIGWFNRLTNSLGRYGLGEKGIISIPVLWDNFIAYQQKGLTPLFIIAGLLLTGFVLLAIRQRNFADHKVLWASAAGFGTQFLVVTLLILKHPGDNYVVSVASVIPVLLFCWFSLHQPTHQLWVGFYMIIASLFLVIFVWRLVGSVQIHNEQKYIQNARITLVDEFLTEYSVQQGKTKDELQIFSGDYAIFDWCEPLWMGNSHSNQVLGELVNQICSNENQWSVWSNTFFVGSHPIAFEDIDNWDVIILRSKYRDGPSFFEDKGVTIHHLDYDLSFITP